jgi:hypothetical protein
MQNLFQEVRIILISAHTFYILNLVRNNMHYSL